MGYATVFHVAARNAARGTYNNTTVPNQTQVIEFIEEASAQIDAWLFHNGYDAPFGSYIAQGLVGTSAQILLQRWAAIGAAYSVEEAAQTSDRLADYKCKWDAVGSAACGQDLPFPMHAGRAFPRGFGEGRGPVSPREFEFCRVTPVKHSGHWDL